MKTVQVSYLYMVFLLFGTSAFADKTLSNDLPMDSLNEDFLEFLADLENVNDVWLHPVNFKSSNTVNKQMKTNKTASETNNE